MEPATQRNSVPPEHAKPFLTFVVVVVAAAVVTIAVPVSRLPSTLPDLPASF